MRLKDMMNLLEWSTIRKDNQFYNNKPWFRLIENDINRFLRIWYGKREILDGLEEVDDALAAIDLCLMSNTWKYDHLYSIYAAEYNPIWNYEGTETREITHTLEEGKTGEDTVSSTGSDTVEHTGDDSTTTSGSYKDQQAGKLQQDRTTFDSATGLNTDGSTDTRSTERTYTNLKDKTDYNSSTETVYGKVDTTSYDSGRNLQETTKETMTRGGNMGVTSTQQMMEQELAVAGKLHLLEVISLDIVQAICYS